MRRTHDLYPRLFQRVIGFPGRFGGRGAGDMERVIMMAEPKCYRIGNTAQLRHLRCRQGAGRGG